MIGSNEWERRKKGKVRKLDRRDEISDEEIRKESTENQGRKQMRSKTHELSTLITSLPRTTPRKQLQERSTHNTQP